MNNTSRFPWHQVHWLNSIFLILTVVLTLTALPWFLWNHGGDITWWVHGPLALFLFIACGMSVTLGYHRMLAHLSFKASWPVRLATLLFGAAAMQASAMTWVSDHRRHHKHVDHDGDPYNITKGFWHAHMGWIMFKIKFGSPADWENSPDLKSDRMIMWQHRNWVKIGLLLGFAMPTLVGYLVDGPIGALGGFLVGGVARLVAVHHTTFFINSLCHTLGDQPYSTRCTARDSWFMALFTFGEGYHNFHHEFQHDYRNGVKAWQFDPTKWAVWTLSKLGLAGDLRRVPNEQIELSEIAEKTRKLDGRLSVVSRPLCSKTEAMYQAAQDRLTAASATWENCRRDYQNGTRQLAASAREQLAQLSVQLETALTELRVAIRQWHAAHRALEGQLA